VSDEVKQDAKNRGIRTLLQGLSIDVLVAIGAGTLAVVATWDGDDVLAVGAWVALAASVIKSVVTAAASFLARLKFPPKE
jgi:hypothetical protein